MLHGNTAVQPYTRLYRRIRLYGYTATQLESSPEEWSELDLPHSRPRACARVTMRVRIMRARARARAPARGDKPLRCSRIINGVEDYRFAVLGSSKNTASHSSILRRTPLYIGEYRCTAVYGRIAV